MEPYLQWVSALLYWGSLIGAGLLLLLYVLAWVTVRLLSKPEAKDTEFDQAMVRAIRRMEGQNHD